MSAIRVWLSRLGGLFAKERRDRELEAEVASHLAMHIEDNVRAGMTAEEARRQAVLKLGGLEQTKESYRDYRGLPWLDTLTQDVRFGLRMLRKNAGFTAISVLTLALGIGANTAIYSVIDAVLVQPLPFGAPDRLVWLNGKMPFTDQAGVSPPDFRDYRANNRTFDRVAAMGYVPGPANLAGDRPEQVLTTIASSNFFECLGVRPLLGRDFLPPDEQVNQPQVAILGNGLWKRNFGGDRNIVGRTIRMDGASLTVVGVLPSDFPLLSEAQVWLPAPMLDPGMNVRLGHSLKAIGRLKPGVKLEQSQADLDAIALRLAHQYPETNKGWSMRQRPLREVLVGPVRPALLLMWGAVGLLLLIACINVANLLLTRSISRQKEFALRVALGASRGRMIRQALTESVLLSFGGGSVGVLAAAWGIRALHALGTLNVPRLGESQINPAVLAFTLGVTFVTGVVCGLVPASQISGGEFVQRLKESGQTSAPRSHKRLSSALVVGEITMSLTLLVSAGLLLKSFWKLIHVAPGFQTEHVVTARLTLNPPAYGPYGDPRKRAKFWRQFEEQVGALPGVEAVGAISELPLTGQNSDDPFYIGGHSYGPSEFDDAQIRQVTPGYLAAMRIPLIAGRWLDERDNGDSAGSVIVNQAFARHFFPDGDVLGKHLQLLGDPRATREIVGVVGNVTHIALSEPDWPEMYVPYSQMAPATVNVVVRGVANPINLSAALCDRANAIDRDVALSAVTSMDDILGASVSQPRFSSQLLGVFAALALLLATIGLYGLMAYSVAERRNEIGIRMALGAQRRDILRIVLGEGGKMALLGIGLGIVASLALTRVMASVLFGVSPSDPLTFMAVVMILFGVALLACWIPARRATRVDPMVALRYE